MLVHTWTTGPLSDNVLQGSGGLGGTLKVYKINTKL